jgi:predicted HicB family RNase H-like nuclease
MTRTNKPQQKTLPVYPVRLQPSVAGRLKKMADRKGWSMHQLMVEILTKSTKSVKKAA